MLNVLVPAGVIVTIPAGVKLVGICTGTVAVLIAEPCVSVMVFELLVRAGAGTLTLKVFVPAGVMVTIPAGVKLVGICTGTVAVLIAEPCVNVMLFELLVSAGAGTFTLKVFVPAGVMVTIPAGVRFVGI